MKFWKRCLGAILLPTSCGSSCDAPPVEPPPPPGPPVVHLTASEPLTLRYRLSKRELTVDCSTAGYDVPVTDELFEPAREVKLASAVQTPLFRPDERSGSDQKCSLLALETRPGHLVVRTQPGLQNYTVYRSASGELELSGAVAITSPSRKVSSCALARELTWSDSLLVGEATVDSVTRGNDGCARVELRGAATETRATWSACMGRAEFPFSQGERIRISSNENPTSKARLVRFARSSGTALELWLLRGAASGFANVGWDPKRAALASLGQSTDCRSEVQKTCLGLSAHETVVVTAGSRSVQLRSDESVSLQTADGAFADVFVVHARFVPIIDSRCAPPEGAGPSDVGLAIVLRGGAAPHAEVAAP